MLIWPVVDLLNGVVVRGVAGQRESYRPISTPLCDGAAPLQVGQALCTAHGLPRLYLADLDAILRQRGNTDVWQALADCHLDLMIDAGVTSVGDAQAVLRSGARRVILGLESVPNPRLLREILQTIGPEQAVFSLDLQHGVPLGSSAWPSEPHPLVEVVLEAGVRSMIVLDLAGVGTGQGVPTLPLCQSLRQAHPEIEWITGGGVNDPDDLSRLAEAGMAGALVASALHDGRIPFGSISVRTHV